jgi:hypothetical protein
MCYVWECPSREFAQFQFQRRFWRYCFPVDMEAGNKTQFVTMVFVTEHLHERGEAVNGRRGTGADWRV